MTNYYHDRDILLNKVNDDDFTFIFDGNNLKDWQMAGDGKFIIVNEEEEELGQEGDILQSHGGMGLLWYTMVYKENLSQFCT
jgi:hypothetical protein